MQNFERLSEKKEYLGDIASRQQEQASNPKYSVFVEASAGTGKTKVLSDRVLRLLLEGVEPGKILCLTYTKAAAVEMKTRINDRLAKWAVMCDEDLCKDLEKLYYKQHVI
ncbi:MAG: UvrD-helicase domain-containing protein, partial [Alphaproteobacteria bacterium]|nr:UvrD-helicase domain-containing protein [Alphaproteobacteria bacterium]